MAVKGFERRLKPLELLDSQEVDAIHGSTLAVLEETGARIEHDEALRFLGDHGCKVDLRTKRVRFPSSLVEECLRRCPSSFTVRARNSKNDLRIGGNRVYFTSVPGMRTVDLDTWEPRSATRKENAEGVIILDALENLHKITCYTPYYDIEGVPPAMAENESTAAKMRHSSKVQLTGYSNDGERYNIRMAKAVDTEIVIQSCASSPLTYFSDAINSALRCVEAGFPLHISPGDIYGGTSPATIAGSIVSCNAEIIAIIVLAQLTKPGTRIIACSFSFPQNMASGVPDFGSIGKSLHHAVFHQVWRRYGIPNIGGSCGFINSKKIDFQCAYERAIPALVCALSGANLIHLHGTIYGELTYHPVQSILDDDIAGMIGRFIAGVEVSDETLAVDLINQVGPIPGHFLDKEHTRKWWKKETYLPRVADSLTYQDWSKKGKKDALMLARERMQDLLRSHKPDSLSEEQEKALGEILEEAKADYKRRGLI